VFLLLWHLFSELNTSLLVTDLFVVVEVTGLVVVDVDDCDVDATVDALDTEYKQKDITELSKRTLHKADQAE